MDKPQAKNLSRQVIRKAKPAQSVGSVSRVGAAVRSTLMALEPRMLFDGAGMATAAEIVKESDARSSTDSSSWIDAAKEVAVTFNAPSATSITSLLVVDQGVQDWQSLVADVAPGTQVLVLDANQDGVSQIARAVSGLTGLQSIQVLSHGDAGQVTLGNRVVDTASLAGYATDLSAIGNSLAANGDILLFGCEVGSGAAGASFLQTLARATNADVAASLDATGAANLGGDWRLEAQVGQIDSVSVLSASAQAQYGQLLDGTVVNNGGVGVIEGHLYDASTRPAVYSNGLPLTLDATDPFENCLPRIEVCLIWAGADGVFQTNVGDATASGDDMIYRVQTGALPMAAGTPNADTYGVYEFSGLAAGAYKICVPTTFTDYVSGNVKVCNDVGTVGAQNDGVIDVALGNGQILDRQFFRYVQINDAPIITAPVVPVAGINVNQGGTIFFDNSPGRLITLADSPNDPINPADPALFVSLLNKYSVTISAAHGILGISPVAGVTEVGSASNQLTLTGTLADLNAAIQGLLYTADRNYVGSDAVTIVLNDHGGFGDANGDCKPGDVNLDNLTDTKTINININTAPGAVPVAVDDVASLCWSQKPVSGNVRANDSDPDTPNANLSVCGVALGGAAGVPSGNVGTAFAGSYGTIVINADGSYTYKVDLTNADVIRLAQAGVSGIAIQDRFTYCLTDPEGHTTKADLVVTIKPNAVPVLAADTGSITVGASTTTAGNVLTNDRDPDGDPTKMVVYALGDANSMLTPESTGLGPINGINGFGTLVVQADGSYIFTLNAAAAAAIPAGQTRTETFNYAVLDDCGGCSKSSIVININAPAPVNLPPVASPDAFTFCVGQTPPTGNVLTNDSDPNGDPLSVCGLVAGNQATVPAGGVGSAVTSANGYGSLTVDASGKYTYVLNTANAAVAALTPTSAALTDVFTYCVTDGQGNQVRSTITITICPPANQAPVPTPDVNTVCVGISTPASGNVLSNDTDPNGDRLSVCGVVAGNQATVPNSGVGSAVNSANGYGVLTVNADGTYSYTLNQTNPTVAALTPTSAALSDVFTYCVTDPSGNQQRTTITITICPPNNAPPVARPDLVCITADRAAPITGNVVSGVGTNSSDSDPNGDALLVQGTAIGSSTAVLNAGVGGTLMGLYGNVTINADGTFIYTLKPNTPALLALKPGDPQLNDVFTYTINDGKGGTSTSTLTICIDGVNDCPIPANDANSVSAAMGSKTGGNVIGGPGASAGDKADTDPDGDKLKVCGVVSGAQAGAPDVGVGTPIAGLYGSLVLNQDGSYTYTVDSTKPAVAALKPGQTLQETFTYCVTDGTCAPQAGRLVVTVTGVNKPPVATGRPDMTTEGGDIKCDLIGVSDPDNTNSDLRITIDSITNAASGSFFLREPIPGQAGQFKETPVGPGSVITGDQVSYLCFRPNPAPNAPRGPDGALLTPTLTFTVRDPDGAFATSSTAVMIKPPVKPIVPVVPPIVVPPVIPGVSVLPVIPAISPTPVREAPITSFVPVDIAPALDPVSLFEPQPFNANEKALDVPTVKSTAVEAKPAAVKADADCVPVKPKVKPKAVKRAIYSDVAKPVAKFSEQLKVAKQRFKLPPKVAPKPALGKDC
jgi:VCBS repeat-containing protein